MIEFELNWQDYLPENNLERFTFASKRNRLVAGWLKTASGTVKKGPIKNEHQTFFFELKEDYDNFLEFLTTL